MLYCNNSSRLDLSDVLSIVFRTYFYVLIFICTGSLVFTTTSMAVTGHAETSCFEVICLNGTRTYFFEALTYAFQGQFVRWFLAQNEFCYGLIVMS